MSYLQPNQKNNFEHKSPKIINQRFSFIFHLKQDFFFFEAFFSWRKRESHRLSHLFWLEMQFPSSQNASVRRRPQRGVNPLSPLSMINKTNSLIKALMNSCCNGLSLSPLGETLKGVFSQDPDLPPPPLLKF